MLFNIQGLENYALLVLRLALAAIFIYHGSKKLYGKQTPFMRFIGVAETLGSIAMLTGFLTQLAGLGLAIIMGGAIYKKITEWSVPFSSDSTTGWEFDLSLFVIALALAFLGAGAFSIDALAGFWP